MGLFLPRCRTLHLPLLNLIRFLSAQPLTLAKTSKIIRSNRQQIASTVERLEQHFFSLALGLDAVLGDDLNWEKPSSQRGYLRPPHGARDPLFAATVAVSRGDRPQIHRAGSWAGGEGWQRGTAPRDRGCEPPGCPTEGQTGGFSPTAGKRGREGVFPGRLALQAARQGDSPRSGCRGAARRPDAAMTGGRGRGRSRGRGRGRGRGRDAWRLGSLWWKHAGAPPCPTVTGPRGSPPGWPGWREAPGRAGDGDLRPGVPRERADVVVTSLSTTFERSRESGKVPGDCRKGDVPLFKEGRKEDPGNTELSAPPLRLGRSWNRSS